MEPIEDQGRRARSTDGALPNVDGGGKVPLGFLNASARLTQGLQRLSFAYEAWSNRRPLSRNNFWVSPKRPDRYPLACRPVGFCLMSTLVRSSITIVLGVTRRPAKAYV